MGNKRVFYNIIVYMIISLLIYFISMHFIDNEEQKQLHQRYTSISTNMRENFLSLLENKKNATHSIAIAASKNSDIKSFLLNQNFSIEHNPIISLVLLHTNTQYHPLHVGYHQIFFCTILLFSFPFKFSPLMNILLTPAICFLLLISSITLSHSPLCSSSCHNTPYTCISSSR